MRYLKVQKRTLKTSLLSNICYDEDMNKYSTVDAFLADLSAERKQQVNLLREIIMSTNSQLAEHIKWNSPSYVFNGEDRITFNMHYPDRTMILLHMGATRKEDKKGTPIMNDATGLIKWNSDIRGTMSFSTVEEIERNKKAITDIMYSWLLLG